jgi:hypothetical protein
MVHNNKDLRRHLILLLIHNSGITNGNLLFVKSEVGV